MKHLFNASKSLCVVLRFAFNSIVMTFLYANMCIIYDLKRCLNFLIMLLIFKFSFHCFFIIKYNLALSSILKMLIFKRFRFVLMSIFSIVSFFKFDLHFVLRNSLIFLISVVIIIFISFLFINIIISFLFIYIFMIIIMMFFIKYNTHDNFDLFIILIDFLCLKYQFDKFLFDSYIRYSLL